MPYFDLNFKDFLKDKKVNQNCSTALEKFQHNSFFPLVVNILVYLLFTHRFSQIWYYTSGIYFTFCNIMLRCMPVFFVSFQFILHYFSLYSHLFLLFLPCILWGCMYAWLICSFIYFFFIFLFLTRTFKATHIYYSISISFFLHFVNILFTKLSHKLHFKFQIVYFVFKYIPHFVLLNKNRNSRKTEVGKYSNFLKRSIKIKY